MSLTRPETESAGLYDLLLGIGGNVPGVRLLRAGRPYPGGVLPLRCGHSVYALDVDSERHQAVAGTRGGAIHLFDLAMTAESDLPQISATLMQGAPVLAVCLLENGCLVSADAAGRCLRWRLPDHVDTPSEFESGEVAIVSLLQVGKKTLAGVSAQGHLCLWDTESLKLHSVLRGPAPSKPAALSRLQSWFPSDALVYPADNGLLAFCNLKERSVKAVPAHRGAFHAMAAAGEELLTFGADDGLLKTWRATHEVPLRTQRIPQGTVSAEILPGSERQILLVGVKGEACIYSIESELPQQVHRLEGGDYRVVAGPSASRRALLERRSVREEACALRARIQARIEESELDGIDELLDKLDDPEFVPSVLALRAQLAAKRGDLAGELAERHRLAQLLPLPDGSGTPSLQRYAALLESAWQLSAAREVHSRIQTAGHGRTGHDWSDRAADIMQQSDWVAAPERPVRDLVQAAAAVKRPFQGCWLLHSAKPLALPISDLSAEMIAAKYEQVRSQETGRSLPAAKACAVWWLAPQVIQRTEMVFLADDPPSASFSVCPALRVHCAGSVPSVTPVLLLIVESQRMEGSSMDQHGNILRCLDEYGMQAEAGTWPPAVHHAMGVALRRLRNRARVGRVV